MAKDRLSGKLAVILYTDIVGPADLVQQDKKLAHERIQASFQRFSDTIEKYQVWHHEVGLCKRWRRFRD